MGNVIKMNYTGQLLYKDDEDDDDDDGGGSDDDNNNDQNQTDDNKHNEIATITKPFHHKIGCKKLCKTEQKLQTNFSTYRKRAYRICVCIKRKMVHKPCTLSKVYYSTLQLPLLLRLTTSMTTTILEKMTYNDSARKSTLSI